MVQSENFQYAKSKMLEALNVVGDTEDHEELANKFGLIVGLSLLQEMVTKVPEDVAVLTQNLEVNQVTPELAEQLKSYFPADELHKMHRDHVRINFQKYMDGMQTALDSAQIEKLQAIYDSIE